MTQQLEELELANLPNMHANQPYQRFGDKMNSDFFEDYLLKIYDWRNKAGLTNNFGKMTAMVVEVDPGVAVQYIAELSVMTLYKYVRSWEADGYRWHLLQICPATPDFLVREVLATDKIDFISAMTTLAVRAKDKPHTKYVGEIFEVADLKEVVAKLDEIEVRFVNDFPGSPEKSYIHWTEPSVYTWNAFGYRQGNGTLEREYKMEREWQFDAESLELFVRMKELQKELGIDKFILPYDHLATRVFSHDREHAILELMRMSSYYYWGSFDIDAQNSSTNVTRPVNDNGFGEVQFEDAYGQPLIVSREMVSPAKVFTANNTPYYVNDFVGLPQPTETFVRNFGRRMHHLAVMVRDGRIVDGEVYYGNEYLLAPEYETRKDEFEYKFVDFVVDQLQKAEQEFLAEVVGSCQEGLKQIFSKSSKFSNLITEYIQRCNDYQGFFTKKNVAALTAAAGMDEGVKERMMDNMITS